MFIFQSNLFENKYVFIELSSIYGINLQNSLYFCKKLGFSLNLKVKNLTKKQIFNLTSTVELSSIIVSVNLKKYKLLLNKNLIDTKSYRGLRKIRGLPIRGQRTHTNAKSARKIN